MLAVCAWTLTDPDELPESQRKERAPGCLLRAVGRLLGAVSGSAEGAQESHRNDSPPSETCCFTENRLAYS